MSDDQLAEQAVEVIRQTCTDMQEGAVRFCTAKAQEGARQLWQWLRGKMTRPVDQGALDGVEQQPEDEANWSDLKDQIRKALEKDPSLAEELARLLPAAGATGATTQSQNQTGNGNVGVATSGSGNSTSVSIGGAAGSKGA